jgi:hypothetical protein
MQVLRLLLCYANANLDDVNASVASEEKEDVLNFNGEEMPPVTEAETEELLKNFQG